MSAYSYAATIAILVTTLAMSRVVRLSLRRVGGAVGIRPYPALWLLLPILGVTPVHWIDPAWRVAMLTVLWGLTWKAVTADFDLGCVGPSWRHRAFLVTTALLASWSPVYVVVNVWVQFDSFEGFKHHTTLPLRLLILGFSACVVHSIMIGVGHRTDEAAALLPLLSCHSMAYLLPAYGKARLGPHWYSWMTVNRLHHVVASAYSWGWGRFIGAKTWIKAVNQIARLNVPLQVSAFTIEATVVFELLDYRFGWISTAGAALFHVGVFVTTGILFWEWILSNAAVMFLLFAIPRSALEQAFGLQSLIWGAVTMLALWAFGRDWRPGQLAWWDTAFTQRIYWKVVASSGMVYGLHNDFFCPHEYQFGRVHGYFFTKEKVCTYHIGEVFRRDLRDAIWQSRGDPLTLQQIKQRWGESQYNEQRIEEDRSYYLRLFKAWNAGVRKAVLPTWLRRLKAPGGQFYYWGDLPRFCGQEQVARVVISYREEYFDGERFSVIVDRVLDEVEIPLDGRGVVVA